jgi:dTDP-4-dehydrorhamnose 3,5-epimerase
MNNPRIIDEPLPGVLILEVPRHTDSRGDFRKLFHKDSLLELGADFTPAESFLTCSNHGVIRGMHYQAGSAAHDKLVYCVQGEAIDVVVDIRPDSHTFNKPISIALSESKNIGVLVPKGYAHGFLSLKNNTLMLYYASTVHNPLLDSGVHWSSIDFEWPIASPVLSERDQQHPRIDDLA